MPAAELDELTRQIKERMGAYLHATDEQAVQRFTDLADLVGSRFAYRAIVGGLAVGIGGVLRELAPHAASDGMFGVLPIAHEILSPAAITGNQLVAAAANRDHDTMHALLTTLLDADDLKAETEVFVGLAKIALSMHRRICAEAHA